VNPIGAHSHLFRGPAPVVAQAIHEHGLSCVQLTPSFPHLRFHDPAEITRDRCRRAAEPFLLSDLIIAGLSAGDNILNPDLEQRHPAIVRLHRLVQHCRNFGTDRVIINLSLAMKRESTEPQTHTGAVPWSSEVRSIILAALRVASDNGVMLLLKLAAKHSPSWKEACNLHAELAHANLGFVMDPAHYLEACQPEDLTRSMSCLCEELNCLAPLVHAKDLRFGPGGATSPRVGCGVLDYGSFFRLYRRYHATAPVILEHVRPSEIDEARKHVQAALRAACAAP
jgi:sugar phosphate isomerase/epimerase